VRNRGNIQICIGFAVFTEGVWHPITAQGPTMPRALPCPYHAPTMPRALPCQGHSCMLSKKASTTIRIRTCPKRKGRVQSPHQWKKILLPCLAARMLSISRLSSAPMNMRHPSGQQQRQPHEPCRVSMQVMLLQGCILGVDKMPVLADSNTWWICGRLCQSHNVLAMPWCPISCSLLHQAKCPRFKT